MRPARRHRLLPTSLGTLTLVGEGEVLVGVYYPEHTTRPDRSAFGPHDPAILGDAVCQLGEYLAGERAGFALATALPTRPALHAAVWELIAAIPRGETRTYSELAARLSPPSHPRAVGGAVARNPLSIVVPCHRVLGRDGALTGYAGGLERKRTLLALEGALSPC